MAELFFLYLRTGFLASVMILAVLLARPFLRKAPRSIGCILWLLVAIRLLLPFQVESPLSLQPREFSEPAAITDVAELLPEPEPVTGASPTPPQETPITEEAGPEPETVFSIIWVFGALAVVLYATVSYGVLRYRVRDAVLCPDGAWESDRIGGAFLLGYFRPQIYIPTGLTGQDRAFILAHERSHQKRYDHWWKLLGMACLSIHWYNPLVWLSYALLCRDIEVACDERVICSMVLEERKSYSIALLNSGKRLSGFLTYPVAFGEISLKSRIKSVLSYRKPGLWITTAAVALTLAVAVCFMTIPVTEAKVLPEETVQTTEPEEVTEPTVESTAPTTEPTAPTETLPPETAPAEPVTTPTEPVPVPTEPATLPTEPTPTQPKPTVPAKPVPKPTEPTTPTKPSVAPTEPKPEPTEPEVTKPADPEVTEPPTTAPTEPPVTEPLPTVPEQEPIGGNCGDNVVWEYNEETQHLSLRGSGPMDTGSTPPWQAYKSRISSMTVGNGITSIAYAAFSGCTCLRSVSIPGSVTRIGNEAFEGCTNLKTVQLHEGLQKIGTSAFRSTGVKSVIIPKTVNRIQSGAFSHCTNLLRITFNGNAPIVESGAFSGTTATAYYPELNGSWQRIMDRCDENLTWALVCTNHSYISGVCERCGSQKGA